MNEPFETLQYNIPTDCAEQEMAAANQQRADHKAANRAADGGKKF